MIQKVSTMAWFAALFACVVILALVVPAPDATLRMLHITQNVYHLLIASMLLPYGIIWFAAFYGYDQLRQYAKLLQNSTEGRAFRKIAEGLGIFAWGLILQALVSSVLTALSHAHPDFNKPEAIFNHYFALLVSLVAFTRIADGTHGLSLLINKHFTKDSIRWFVLGSTAVGIIFTRLVIHNNNISGNPYYLDVYPLIVTLIIPYVYAWVIGFMAIAELRLYTRTIRGILYNRALRTLTDGITIVLMMSIVTQYISAVFVASGQPLSVILLLVYVLLAVQGVGFALVALGSKRLKRIEEI